MSTQGEAAPIDQLSINTIRTLSMDAVQAANSGHPGTPMAMAPLVYCLWQRLLRFDPDNPIWMNRDRFVLSAGHASMLLYSILHLTGVKAVNAKYERLGELSVKLEDIKHFRQLESKCPGHPEYRWTSGVETTTGPLGQGVATSVGMAMAERWLGAHFNRPGFELFNYNVYGAPTKQDTKEAHGEPLGEEEIRLAKRSYRWPENEHFLVPEGVREHFQEGIGKRGAQLYAQWSALFESYREHYPELADQLRRIQWRELPDGWDRDLSSFAPDPKGLATREVSGKVLNAIAKNVPWLVGGSADLS